MQKKTGVVPAGQSGPLRQMAAPYPFADAAGAGRRLGGALPGAKAAYARRRAAQTARPRRDRPFCLRSAFFAGIDGKDAVVPVRLRLFQRGIPLLRFRRDVGGPPQFPVGAGERAAFLPAERSGRHGGTERQISDVSTLQRVFRAGGRCGALPGGRGRFSAVHGGAPCLCRQAADRRKGRGRGEDRPARP